MRKKIIGVMGPGAGATERDKTRAYELGKMIAENGWVLLSGGRNVGVMDAVSRGAHDAGGLVIGILPGKDGNDASEGVDIPILTGMGGGRNVINVLSSDVVIACGMGAGTASEVAHAIKIGKSVILLEVGEEAKQFFQRLSPKLITICDSVSSAIIEIQKGFLNLII